MLKITDLSVTVEDKVVVNNFSLNCLPGSLHIIMGPNGSGKSSCASALMGHPRFVITNGTIQLGGMDITALPVEKRARAGLFLAFQYPYEIPGVQVFTFIKEAHRALTGADIGVIEFKEKLVQTLQQVGLDESFAHRYLNDGFSGGEKKRLELVQLLMLKPKVAILDEIDSGLDADGIKKMGAAIAAIRQTCPDMVILVITHYAHLVEYLVPDAVHIFAHGRLVASGDTALTQIIQTKGYSEFLHI